MKRFLAILKAAALNGVKYVLITQIAICLDRRNRKAQSIILIKQPIILLLVKTSVFLLCMRSEFVTPSGTTSPKLEKNKIATCEVKFDK